MALKKKGRRVDGVLLLDKPLGITSNAALQIVKRLYCAQKAGHTGSLDPLATGLLPICFGEATKYSQFLLDADKRYEVTAKLGVITDSGDADGKVIEEREVESITPEQFAAILSTFHGEIEQVPSMFSALKFQGKPLYELARQGISIERKSRKIQIYEAQCTELTPTTFSLQVYCSKGTYIRSLVEDIGLALGCGAHVIKLRRTGAGPFVAPEMHTLESLQQLDAENLDKLLLPVDALLASLPILTLSESAAAMIQQGKKVEVKNARQTEQTCLYNSEGIFIGVGAVDERGMISARRLIRTII